MCSIGKFLNSECSLAEENLRSISLFDIEDQHLLKYRTNCKSLELICDSHTVEFLTRFSLNQKNCCDPFNTHPETLKKKDLREIDVKCMKQYSDLIQLIPGKKICSRCRKLLPKKLEDFHNEDLAITPTKSQGNDNPFVLSPECDSEILNKSLAAIGESPLDSRKLLHTKSYPKRKMRSITKSVKKKLKLFSSPTEGVHNSSSSSSDEAKNKDTCEIIDQLKEKFKTCKNSEKVTVLSVLPQTWSIRKIEREFGASQYMVRKTKKLVAEQGIFATPNSKAGKILTVQCVELVKKFYEEDDVS